MEITPSKTCVGFINPNGCIICQKDEQNTRKRKSLGGKVSKAFVEELVNVLEVPIDLLSRNTHRYICANPCSKDIDNFCKCEAKANELKNNLQKRAFANLDKRIKRGVPSDTVTESCVRVRPAKSLSFPASTATQEITECQVLPSLSGVCRIPLLPAPITKRPDDQNKQEDVPSIEEECENIHISIKYPSGKTSNKPLPEQFHKIGKALIRNASSKSIATAVLVNKKLKESILKQICAEIENETKNLCSTKSPSILKTPTKESLLNFSWELIGKEVCEKSPVTFQILQAVAVPNVSKNIAGCSKRLPGILLAVGVLSKTRDPTMSLIPYMISLILKAAGTSKKGIVRLNHLGLCMSPKSLNKVLDDIGKDYSISLIEHQEALSVHMKQEKELIAKETCLVSQLDDTVQNDSAKHDLKSSLQELRSEISALEAKRPPGYCIVLDNLDIMIKVADMTSDNQNKDNHWCNHNAIIDRVNPLECEDNQPLADILDIPNSVILPTVNNHEELLKDFVVLVSRVFVEHFTMFQIFQDIVPSHIQHKHSDEMKKKTQKVNLGIIFKDENLGEDMIDIVRDLHNWVPTTGDKEHETFNRVPVVGDQKTMERGVEAQFSVSNAYTRQGRLDGLFFQLADWHHENKFLGVLQR